MLSAKIGGTTEMKLYNREKLVLNNCTVISCIYDRNRAQLKDNLPFRFFVFSKFMPITLCWD